MRSCPDGSLSLRFWPRFFLFYQHLTYLKKYAILKKNTREKSKRAEDEKYIQKIRRSDPRARGDVLARIVRQEKARRRGQRDGDVVSGTYRIHGRADRRVDGASDGA